MITATPSQGWRDGGDQSDRCAPAVDTTPERPRRNVAPIFRRLCIHCLQLAGYRSTALTRGHRLPGLAGIRGFGTLKGEVDIANEHGAPPIEGRNLHRRPCARHDLHSADTGELGTVLQSLALFNQANRKPPANSKRAKPSSVGLRRTGGVNSVHTMSHAWGAGAVIAAPPEAMPANAAGSCAASAVQWPGVSGISAWWSSIICRGGYCAIIGQFEVLGKKKCMISVCCS